MIEPFTYETLPGRVVFGAGASREEENIDEAVGLILEDAYAGPRPELVLERSV